jgi:hypothetical protein
LARQLARVDAMIADPTAKVTEWQVSVLENHPEKLASRADAFMTGIERAAAITGRLRYAARESGRILAGLVANLPMTASSRSVHAFSLSMPPPTPSTGFGRLNHC